MKKSKSDHKKKITVMINKTSITDAMHDSYAEYVKYVLLHRALPDIRDGLKPVQRKIIYALYKLNLVFKNPPKKSARTVGEIIAKYHPHGDTSVYSSLVRMSQYWKLNYPLVEMQGNNGSIDGDNPAAMRYTEARLSNISSEYVIENIRFQSKSNFIPNFDNSEEEPVYLQTYIPLLLINGQTGIASGYATEVPPHNLREIINGLICLIKNRKTSLTSILRIIKGPDFPTGGQFLKTSLLNAYKTGKGKLTLCSNFNIKFGIRKNFITITQIPYGVQKGILVRQLELIRLKVFCNELIDVRDESDGTAIRIVIELRKSVNVNDIIDYICSKTHFQVNYNFNMTVIKNNRPQLIGLLELLQFHIDQSCEVMKVKTTYLLNEWIRRSQIIKCLLIVVANIREVLKLIMNAKNRDEAKHLLAKRFDFTVENADHVLDLRLYRLSAFDINKLNNEQKQLMVDINKAKLIVKNRNNLLEAVTKKYIEILTFCKKTGNRRTKSGVKSIFSSKSSKEQELHSKEEYNKRYIILTNLAHVYQSKKPVNESKITLLSRKLQKKEWIIAVNLQVSDKKNVYLIFSGGWLIIDNLKKLKTFNSWIQLNNHFKFDLYKNNVIATINQKNIAEYSHILFITRNGQVKLILIRDFLSLPNGILTKFIRLKSNDSVQSVIFLKDSEMTKYILIAKKYGNCVLFNMKCLKTTKVRSGTIAGTRVKQLDNYVVFATLINNIDEKIKFISREGRWIVVNTKNFYSKIRPAVGKFTDLLRGDELWKGVSVANSRCKFIIKYNRVATICSATTIQKIVSAYSIDYQNRKKLEIEQFSDYTADTI